MIIQFRGLRTGREYATPLRYLAHGGLIYSFSNRDTKWWRNLEGETLIRLKVQGNEGPYIAHTVLDGATIRPMLLRMLKAFPQDAGFHGLTLDSEGEPDEREFENTLMVTVMVIAKSLN